MWLSQFLEESLSINLGVTNELMLFALIVMFPIGVYLAKKFSIPQVRFFFALIPSVYVSYVVSHVFHLFFDATVGYIKFLTRPDFSLATAFFEFWGTATMFYGSLIGCLLGMALCYPLFRKDKRTFLHCFDAVIICFAFSSIFSRIADIYTGESYGFVFDSPFSMHYWPGSVPSVDMFTRGMLDSEMLPPPLFPTQPIMVIAKVIILLVLLIKCFTDKKKVPLSYVALYFVLYGPYRLFIDFCRFDRASYFLGLTVSQWISIVLVVLAVLYYKFLYKKLADENYSFRFWKINFKKTALFALVFLVFLAVFAWKGLNHYDDGESENVVENDNGLADEQSAEKPEIFWSKISYTMPWQKAKEYCENLDEDGFSDWRLPDIDELRTLVKNHSGTQAGGTCRISEKAGKLSSRDRTFRDCNGRKGSDFSDLPKKEKFWSSSVLSDFPYDRWYVDLSNGGVYTHDTGLEAYVICAKNTGVVYDVVVVGGGLTGLSAAYHLKKRLGEDAKILILEKEDRLGGRVWTKKFGEYFYELGATFAYSPLLVPEGFELPELVVAPDSYGEYRNGKLTFSNKIDAYQSFLLSGSNELGNGKHYGKYDYLSHRIGGNGTMIEAYEKELEGKFMLEAEVVSIQNDGKNNVVRYKKGEKEHKITAKTVIVTTTATVASKIIKGMKQESEKFVKSVSYDKRAVANLLVRLDKPLDFASINSENLLLYPIKHGNGIYSLYCYIWNATEKDDYVDFSKSWLTEVGILDEKSEILHIDSYFWQEELTSVLNKTYENFSENALNPLPGVFLSGDYTFWSEAKLSLGMPPAYLSGRRAAEKVDEYLRKLNNLSHFLKN